MASIIANHVMRKFSSKFDAPIYENQSHFDSKKLLNRAERLKKYVNVKKLFQ